MKFYRMGSANKRGIAIARLPKDFDQYAFWDSLDSLERREQWSDLNLKLDEGKMSDSQPNDAALRLFSHRVRDLFESFPNPDVLWLPVKLDGEKEIYEYWYPWFAPEPDVLNKQKSKFVAGRLFRPWISLRKAKNKPYFAMKTTAKTLIVREDVREAIKKAKLKVFEFENIDCS